jgi:adenylate cyclase
MNESAHSLTKTILEMDLVAYSDVARLLEENLNVEAVKIFQDQIQQFVDYGLSAVSLRRDDVVIDTAGDNAILMFDDVETMHKFAQAVQTQTLAHNSSRSLESAKRWFRMGAATGIVLIMPAERRVFGTTIARAVRLEAAAEIGQLLVDLPTFDAMSDEIKETYSSVDIVRGKRAERFECRRCTLIDVPRIEEIAVQPPQDRPRSKFRGKKPSPLAHLDGRPAIAVLPFSDKGDDPAHAYLSQGITDDIINELASWRLFPVISRSSTFGFKNHPVDIVDVRRKLGVRYLVEGTVNKIGQRIRVSARLVDAVTGLQLASERFDRSFEELPEVQDQIAEMIAGSIAPEVLRIERYRVSQKLPNNNTAYEHFLRGLEAHYRYTKADNVEAQLQFTKAINADSHDARSHALLAHAMLHAVQLGWREDKDHNYTVADQLARRAVSIDPRAPLARFALGSTSMFLGRIDQALMEMREAIRLNPSHAAAHAIMAPLLCYVGRADEALDSVRRALNLSPYDPRLGLWLALVSQAQYFLKAYEEAAVIGQHALSLISENPLAHRFVAASLGQLSRTKEAEPILLIIRRSSTPSLDAIRNSVGHLYREGKMIEHMLDGLKKAGLH